MLKTLQTILLFAVLLVNPNLTFASDFIAVANGNWSNISTWNELDGLGIPMPALTSPGAGDNVTIDGYQVIVNTNVTCNSITVSVDSRSSTAELELLTGYTLNITSNLNAQTLNNRNNHVDLLIYGILNIGGNLIFTRSANNNVSARLKLTADDATINITGDIIYNHYHSAIEGNDEFNLLGNTIITCNNASFRKDYGNQMNLYLHENALWNILGNFNVYENGGDDFEFYMEDNSKIDITGDLNVLCNGAEDFQWNMSQTGGVKQFHVGGNVFINHDSSEDIDVNLTNSAEISIDGNFTIDWDGARANDSDVDFELKDDSKFEVLGSYNVNLNESVRGTCDFLLDMEDDSKFLIGTNNGLLTESAVIEIVDGDQFLIRTDDDSKLVIYGSLSLIQDGDNNMYLDQNQGTSGSTSDSQWQIDGDFNISKNDGDNFRYWLNYDCDLMVGGNFNILLNGFDSNGQTAEFQLQEDASAQISGNFNYQLNTNLQINQILDLEDDCNLTIGTNDGSLSYISNMSTIDGNQFIFEMDDNASFRVFGDATFNQSGNERMLMYLNYYVNGSTTDAQLQVDGNLDITKDDGDNFYLDLSRNSGIQVGQDFNIDISEHDGTWQEDNIRLDNNSSITVNNDFIYNLHPSLFVNTYIRVEHNGFIDVHGNSTISQIDAGYMYLYFNQSTSVTSVIDAVFRTQGNLNINYQAIQDWAEFQIVENQDANIIVGGDFNLTNSSNFIDATYINLDRNALLDVSGNFNINHTSKGDLQINLNATNNGSSTDAQLNVGADFNISATQVRYFIIYQDFNSDIKISNDLNIDVSGFLADWGTYTQTLYDDAGLTTGNNLNISKTFGSDFNINLTDDAFANISGSSSISASNGVNWSDFYLILNNNALFTSEKGFDFINNSSATTTLSKIELTDNSVLNIGTNNGVFNDDFNFNHNSQGDMQILTYNNASINVYGSFTFDKQNNGLWSLNNIILDDASNINVSKHLLLKNSNNDNLVTLLLIDDNAVVNVRGNIDLTSAIAQDRILIDLQWKSNLHIGGSFLRNASPNRFGTLYCENESTVHYDGDGTYGQQTIAENYGDGTDAFNYQYVVINNTWNIFPQLTMEGTAEIITNRNLSFSDGIVESTSSNYFIIQDNATVSNASDNSYVQGYIHKVGNDAFTFPVGNTDSDLINTRYAPLSISAPSSTTTDFFCAYWNMDPNNVGDRNAIASTIDHISHEEYWLLEPVVGTPNVNVTLVWNNPRSGNIDDISELRIAHWNNTIWEDYGNDGTTGDILSGSLVTNNVTTFSPFTISSTSSQNPLPVELITFEVEKVNTTALLLWRTTSEINNNFFDIQRSYNGIDFESIGEVSGFGNSNDVHEYQFIDNSPLKGYSYYRLVQHDFDETTENSDIKSIYLNSNTDVSNISEFDIFPNPIQSNQKLNIQTHNNLNLNIEVVIYDLSGKMWIKNTLNTDESISFNDDLPSGLYIVQIEYSGQIERQKLIVE
ncbi:MAG: T9SS type A sorting domain-containing protein [Bacteroidales bacterium]|nr:T9SS type A sorting domain-containing protein [Bacteroidales bacterium]